MKMTKLALSIIAGSVGTIALSKAAFLPRLPTVVSHICSRQEGLLRPLDMAKAKKKKKKKGGGSSGGIKGFGSSATATSPSTGSKRKKATAGLMDRSKETMAFYDYMERYGAGDNLKRVALGEFPLPNTDMKIRGVMALRDMAKGDVIIRIPYEMAVNLGPQGEDPTLPGRELLKLYCNTLRAEKENVDPESGGIDQSTYFEMLPKFMGSDCLGSTVFFSQDALEALQSPLLMESTFNQRERAKKRFEESDDFPSWIDGSEVTEQHMQWATWLITSRVLTVQGDAEEGKSYRLLIPFLDMCNHDRSSPNVLTGRAVPGGELKVVASAPIQAGEQVYICYGGGVAGNDRFLQDYGFLDFDKVGYTIVAQQLLGKRRILEGSNKGRTIASVDKQQAMEALGSTSLEQDEALLAAQNEERDLRAAVEYRAGVKKALSGFMEMQ